jgi:hypothetical protein
MAAVIGTLTVAGTVAVLIQRPRNDRVESDTLAGSDTVEGNKLTAAQFSLSSTAFLFARRR